MTTALKKMAAFLADMLAIASVEYESETLLSPNPFNALFGRYEPRDYWGICYVVDSFVEIMKYDFREADRVYVRDILYDAFMSLYGTEVNPLRTLGEEASYERWGISYTIRARECVRIANHIRTTYEV